MSILLETTHGNIVIDLYYQELPITCFNFIKLCSIKYFQFCKFHSLEKDKTIEFSDKLYPISRQGVSIWDLFDSSKRSIKEAVKPGNVINNEKGIMVRGFKPDDMLIDKKLGSVSLTMNNKRGTSKIRIYLDDPEQMGNQIYNEEVVFGQVAEGFSTLNSINDNDMHSNDVIIRNVFVLEDPFEMHRKNDRDLFLGNIANFRYINEAVSSYQCNNSDSLSAATYPNKLKQYLKIPRDLSKLEEGEKYLELLKSIEEDEFDLQRMEKQEMESQALTLELLGDLPSRSTRPLESILFVCKLNPITTDDDLNLIFNKFGDVVQANVVKDKDSGTSLCYAFVEFRNKESCEFAYMKIIKNDLVIDGRKVRVDFSQSVRNKRKRKNMNY